MTTNDTLSTIDYVRYAGGILLSLILGAGVVIFGLELLGLGRFATGAAGQITGIVGAFAGLAVFFALLSYRHYREY